jgi:hypothetical protein
MAAMTYRGAGSRPHKGFDLEEWKARQQDFEGTIREAYGRLITGPRAEEVRDIVAPHIETDPALSAIWTGRRYSLTTGRSPT